MKHFCRLFVILVVFLYTSALVHVKKLDKGAKGCKSPDGDEMKVGEFLKDSLTCGLIMCENEEGDGLIYFCQKTLPFAECDNEAINTKDIYPKCCYTCVDEVQC